MRTRTQYVICLAGHIDHGKSAIVQALTGAAVDRLPEEKRRGITIELGFSHFDANGCRFALIDVPGHERFIHTMVAGASGVDAALLVIAADDSVMPQTREHLALLQLLGIQRGVIAVSKCDLADEEQLELVELEISELVAGTFLNGAPRIRTSAAQSRGIVELREALVKSAMSSPWQRRADSTFRLPVDRAFSPAGQGAVVTGTVWRGSVRVGDTLHLLPAELPVRIRRLQSQGADVECVAAGERAAINLAGVKATAIQRGDELVTPGSLQPAKRHLVELRLLPETEHDLKHRQFVRVHLGANQETAQVLMAERQVSPGQSAFAVLRCTSPIVAEYGQPFVLRQLSPARTIGGGTFIGPALDARHRLTRSLDAAPGLASTDPVTRMAASIELRGETILDASTASSTGLTSAQCEEAIRRLTQRKQAVCCAGAPPVLISSERFDQLRQRFLRYLQAELERRRPASQVPLSVILSAMSPHASEPVLQMLMERMTAAQEIVGRCDRVGLPTGPALTNRQRALLNALLSTIAENGATPPSLKELADEHHTTLEEVNLLLQVALDEGRLVRIAPLFVFEARALESLRTQLLSFFQTKPAGTVSEIREHWHMTRKHAVPILAYFDECHVTLRTGDSRSPGPRLSVSFAEGPT